MAPKPFSLSNAVTRLTPFATRPLAQSDESELVRLLERLPPGVPMELVSAAMKRLADGRGVEWLFWAPRSYAPAVAEIIHRSKKKEPLSVFLRAALPSKPEEWGEDVYELRDAFDAINYSALARARKGRDRRFAPYVKDARVVTGAQAWCAAFPDDPDDVLLFLAFEGSEASLDVILPAVKKKLAEKELDFLTDDVVPLLTRPAAASLKALILEKTSTRNAGSWGLQAARALGLTQGDALKFKVSLFAQGDWPKLRMWFDSTKDPSVGGIWNFNEHVHFARHDPKKTPLKNLEAVTEKLRLEATENQTTWVRGQFSSPMRAPFKATLAAWVQAQLPGVAW